MTNRQGSDPPRGADALQIGTGPLERVGSRLYQLDVAFDPPLRANRAAVEVRLPRGPWVGVQAIATGVTDAYVVVHARVVPDDAGGQLARVWLEQWMDRRGACSGVLLLLVPGEAGAVEVRGEAVGDVVGDAGAGTVLSRADEALAYRAWAARQGGDLILERWNAVGTSERGAYARAARDVLASRASVVAAAADARRAYCAVRAISHESWSELDDREQRGWIEMARAVRTSAGPVPRGWPRVTMPGPGDEALARRAHEQFAHRVLVAPWEAMQEHVRWAWTVVVAEARVYLRGKIPFPTDDVASEVADVADKALARFSSLVGISRSSGYSPAHVRTGWRSAIALVVDVEYSNAGGDAVRRWTWTERRALRAYWAWAAALAMSGDGETRCLDQWSTDRVRAAWVQVATSALERVAGGGWPRATEELAEHLHASYRRALGLDEVAWSSLDQVSRQAWEAAARGFGPDVAVLADGASRARERFVDFMAAIAFAGYTKATSRPDVVPGVQSFADTSLAVQRGFRQVEDAVLAYLDAPRPGVDASRVGYERYAACVGGRPWHELDEVQRVAWDIGVHAAMGAYFVREAVAAELGALIPKAVPEPGRVDEGEPEVEAAATRAYEVFWADSPGDWSWSNEDEDTREVWRALAWYVRDARAPVEELAPAMYAVQAAVEGATWSSWTQLGASMRASYAAAVRAAAGVSPSRAPTVP